MNRRPQMSALFLAVVTWTLASTGAAAQFQFQDYTPVTFDQINKATPPISLPGIGILGLAKKYKVRATFRGNVRPLAAESTSVLDAWTKSLNIPAATRALFSREILVRDGEVDYWMPIQEPVLEWLLKEVKAGGVADFYIMHPGSHVGRQPSCRA
jgi:hypothetical protein